MAEIKLKAPTVFRREAVNELGFRVMTAEPTLTSEAAMRLFSLDNQTSNYKVCYGLMNIYSSSVPIIKHSYQELLLIRNSIAKRRTIAPEFGQTKEHTISAEAWTELIFKCALDAKAVPDEVCFRQRLGETKSRYKQSFLRMLETEVMPTANLVRIFADPEFCAISLENGAKISADFILKEETTGVPFLAIAGGVVFILQSSAVRMTITDQISFACLYPALANHFYRVKEGKDSIKFTDDISIGMDPELEGYYFEKGTDSIDFNSQCVARCFFQTYGRVGCDGHNDIFELRPGYSKDPLIVARNTQECFETLGYGLAAKVGTDGMPFLMAGGGLVDSLGGHIHISGKFFREISTDEIADFFGKIMDDFVYYPMRECMPGAVRSWGLNPEISRHRDGGHAFIDPKDKAIFEKEKNKKKISRSRQFSGYDCPSEFRFPEYGLEYRSLPSFIVNRELTELVLIMAKCAAVKMLECYNQQKGFSYNTPPKKSDYLSIFPEKIYHRFMRYINGEKKDIFLTNVLKNWGVDESAYVPCINISGNTGTKNAMAIGMHLTKALRQSLEGIKKMDESLKELKLIDVVFHDFAIGGVEYMCKCGNYVYAKSMETASMKIRGITDTSQIISPQNMATSVTISTIDSCGIMRPAIDAIALMLASRIGINKFRNIQNILLKSVSVTELWPNLDLYNIYDIAKIVDPLAPETIRDENDEDDWEATESFHSEPECTRMVDMDCDCEECMDARGYREDNCENCNEAGCRQRGRF